jgi:hypothetical protein
VFPDPCADLYGTVTVHVTSATRTDEGDDADQDIVDDARALVLMKGAFIPPDFGWLQAGQGSKGRCCSRAWQSYL